MLDSLIYGLCAVMAFLCAVLLLQGYSRGGHRLLLWSGLCFVGLTLNNLLLVADKVVFQEHDLSAVRSGAALLGMIVLMYGLICDQE